MRLTLCALLVGGSLFAIPHASAAPLYDWRGTACSFETVVDTTPGAQLGGQNVWNGVVYVAVRAVNNDAGPDPDGDGPLVGTPATPAPTVAVSVSCGLSINGGTPSPVLTASGTGVAAIADQIQFTAASGSVVVMCSNMVIGGESIQDCGIAEETPICPDPVCGPGGAIEVITDAAVCSALAALTPGVPGVAIGPTGDTSVLGTTVWDCSYNGPSDSAVRASGPDQSSRGHMHSGPKPPPTTVEPLTPYYPAGTITMSQALGGQVTYDMTGYFRPTVGSWICTPAEDTMTSISCRPPAAPSGSYNVCGTVRVSAKSTAVGTVAATSSCAAGVMAATQSTGPAASPSTSSASPNTDFPWICAANPGSSLDWTVTCTVN